MKKLSETQRRILRNAQMASEGKAEVYFPVGMSQHGGWGAATMALARKGFLDFDGRILQPGIEALSGLAGEKKGKR